jgi:protein SCO1
MRRVAWSLAVLALASVPGVSRAGGDDLVGAPEKFFTPRLGDQVPLDLTFRDEKGRPVRLGEFLGEKPAILVLAYYRCPRLCTLVLNDLCDSLRQVPFTAGREFEVVVVSFDARETPALAGAKKMAYVESYGRPGGEDGWHFLTGRQPEIDRLMEAVGFRAVWDPEQKQFAHARGILVLTPGGRVARYFLGGYYPPRDLRLALVESSEGKISAPMDRVLLMCFSYNPSTGRYSAAVLGAVRVGGVLTVLGVVAFWLARWRRGRPAAAAVLPGGPAPAPSANGVADHAVNAGG